LAWEIEYSKSAEKTLLKLDSQIARRIVKFLGERIARLENPRSIGEALTGNELGNYWKYRVGDFRIVVDIEDKRLRILVIKVGNRRDVYR
jgi:mRNA interferase RelE/StbE